MLKGMMKDDAGNTSSFRFVWIIVGVMQVWLLALFSWMMMIEIQAKIADAAYIIDYQGLAILFGAFFGNGGVLFFTKAYQKKYETKRIMGDEYAERYTEI